jgi:hypothetical protein
VIDTIAGAVKIAREQAESLVHLEGVTLADKSQPHAVGLLQLSNAAMRSAERVARALDGARAKALNEIERIDRRTSTPPPPRDSLALSLESEMRARLAAMPEKQRDEAIAQAFKEQDTALVHAVMRGHAMLVGLGKAKHDLLRYRFMQEFFPGDYARKQKLQKVLDRLTESGNLFVSIIRAATEAPGVQLAAAAKQQREEMLAAHSAGE